MIKEKKCRICGCTFVPKSSRQLDCNKVIIKHCAVCGKEFESTCSKNSVSSTCSKECMNKLASANRQISYSKQIKKCILCGKEFSPKNNTQVVCSEKHFGKCVVCGKEFELNYDPNKGRESIRKTCSKECFNKLMSISNGMRGNSEAVSKIESTMMSRYGVRHASQNKDIIEKQKKTMKDRYGVEFFSQSPEYRDKAEATNLNKYGVKWPIQSNEIKMKRDRTNIERFGTANVMEVPEIVQKIKQTYFAKTGYDSPSKNPQSITSRIQTCNDRYGVDNYSQTSEFKERFINTSKERYGVPNPMQSDEIKNKSKETFLRKYGSTNYLSSEEGKEYARKRLEELYGKDHYSKLKEWKEKIMIEGQDVEKWTAFTENPEAYLKSYSEKPTYYQLSEALGVRPSTVCDFICRRNLRDMIKNSMSYMEEEIKELLLLSGVEFDMHCRTVIAPYELDFYIPSLKLGIECNPTCTHNSSKPFKGIDVIEPLKSGYHKMKTDMCEKAGVDLFHIFGYEWTNNKYVIKSMLLSRINSTSETIYARKCKVVEVPWDSCIEFLSANHRQGAANSPIRLGLEYEGKLVSIMTFGKMRHTIGTDSEDLSNCYELVRFCSLLNTSVVGGASKLFKHFVKEYDPSKIRSFSDRAHTTGKLYNKLGFKELRRSDPGYVWVKESNDVAYHRVNAQKKNIKKFLKDETIDLSRTETEIMTEHGFVQVFDSGTITWEWQK